MEATKAMAVYPTFLPWFFSNFIFAFFINLAVAKVPFFGKKLQCPSLAMNYTSSN
jgi:hypothetical protein